ncbi:S-adenosyl-L-methionine-dependent methyltransferase [Dissophora ornata]|nr:hypothetical protein BGZ58_005034 [Dissophora ornata]KAI8601794.1 S-adenosyl-L-methionine-dependent methyltransferase [Dissophora ornata]
MSDIQSLNNQHFNKTAKDYDSKPQADEMTQRASKVIIEEFVASTSEEHVKNASVLEFGCGTGLCMFQVARKVKQALGVDASEGMLQHLSHKLETREENADIRGKIKTVNHLITEDVALPEPEFSQYLSGPDAGFDMIYSSFVMHHIEDVQGIVNTLSGKLLKKGGWLIVTDFQGSHKSHGHGDGHTHGDGYTHRHNHSQRHGGDHKECSKTKDIQGQFLDADGKPVELVPHLNGFTLEGFAGTFKKAGLVDVSAKQAFGMNITMHGNNEAWTDVLVVKGRLA